MTPNEAVMGGRSHGEVTNASGVVFQIWEMEEQRAGVFILSAVAFGQLWVNIPVFHDYGTCVLSLSSDFLMMPLFAAALL